MTLYVYKLARFPFNQLLADLFSLSQRSFENCENAKNEMGVGWGDETFVV
jgi:hypothetical protein